MYMTDFIFVKIKERTFEVVFAPERYVSRNEIVHDSDSYVFTQRRHVAIAAEVFGKESVG